MEEQKEVITLTNEEIAQGIQKEITRTNPGMVVLFTSLTGSRAKGLDAPDSDYDTKSIVLDTKRNYYLQKAKSKTIDIETKVKGIQVEGACVDLHHFYEYIRGQNLWCAEALRAKNVFSITEDFLKEIYALYEENFDPFVLAKQYSGWLKRERRINTKNYTVFKVEAKYVLESIHCANILTFLCKFPGKIPPRDFQDVLLAIELDEDLKKEIIGLYEIRRRNKRELVDMKGLSEEYVKEMTERDYKELEGTRKGRTKEEELDQKFLDYLEKYAEKFEIADLNAEKAS